MGVNETIGGGGFHHVAMKVKDFERSIQFYVGSLGFKQQHEWELNGRRMAQLDAGDGNYLEVVETDEEGLSTSGVIAHIALRTADCDKATEVARAAGATVTREPSTVDLPSDPPLRVRVSFCTGPDGELIEFVQDL